MINKAEVLQDYTVVYNQVVVWGDMDAFDHVNNVVFYRYAENARIHYLHELSMFATNNVQVLAQSTCTYLKPVRFPDTLQIGVRCKKIGNTSIIFEYLFFSQSQQTVVATAEAVVVSLDVNAEHKQAWTADQRQRVFDLEQKSGHIPHF